MPTSPNPIREAFPARMESLQPRLLLSGTDALWSAGLIGPRPAGEAPAWPAADEVLVVSSSEEPAAPGDGPGSDWFVRPLGGAYGMENGTSHDNAWDGISRINWQLIAPGDTLWMSGNFFLPNDCQMTVGASGTAGSLVTIRGDASSYDASYPDALWAGAANAGYYEDGWTLEDAEHNIWRIWNTNGSAPHTCVEDGVRRLTRRYDTDFATWAPGSFHKAAGGGGWLYYKPSDDQSANDHTFSNASGTLIDLNGEDYLHLLNLEVRNSITSNGMVRLVDSDYVTIEGCTFEAAEICVHIREDSDHGQVLDSHIGDTGGPIYLIGAGNDDWTIRGNEIYDVNQDGHFYSYDSHGIGLQTTKGTLIEYNHVHHCGGSGITFYQGTSLTEMEDNVVRYNFVHDVADLGGEGRNQRGIEYGNTNSPHPADYNTGNRVYGNIVAHIVNEGLRNKSQASDLGDTWVWFNNTVYATGDGYEFHDRPTGNSGFRVKNTIFAETAYRHMNHEHSGDAYDAVDIDYNLYDPDGGWRFDWITGMYDFDGWRAASGQDANSPTPGTPMLLNGSGTWSQAEDFQLGWNSPAIDAGTVWWDPAETMVDYGGNPIYGAPDIGAWEYQPPYEMGTDAIDATAEVRVYADGKFRYLTAPGGTSAELSVMPEGGWDAFGASDARPEWMDVDVQAWNDSGDYYRRWVETADLGSTSTVHTIGGLAPNANYNVHVDGAWADGDISGAGVAGGVVRSDGSGVAAFTYTGGYSAVTFELSGAVAGDFNADGQANAADIDLLLAEAAGGTHRAPFDLTFDGQVDSADTDALVQDILGTHYGDANLDGAVDLNDLSTLAGNWNQSFGMGWANGDFTGDGAVDLNDLSLLAGNWGA